MTTIAFIGLGAMGAPMATHLISAGHTLRLHNRSAEKAHRLANAAAVVCNSPAEAAQGAEFVVSMVADDDATREVMLGVHGIVHGAGPGTIVLDSSTNTPDCSRAMHAALAERGIEYLDAPVSGSIDQAAAAQLVFMVGGGQAAFERCGPLFDAMGRSARRLGGPGTGATIKLVNNFLSGTTSAALAEAMMVAEAAGIGAEDAAAILNEGASASRLMRSKMTKMQQRDFVPQFQLALMEKDLRYFLSLAQSVDRPAPIGALVRSQYQAARRSGLGKLDVAAILSHVNGETSAG